MPGTGIMRRMSFEARSGQLRHRCDPYGRNPFDFTRARPQWPALGETRRTRRHADLLAPQRLGRRSPGSRGADYRTSTAGRTARTGFSNSGIAPRAPALPRVRMDPGASGSRRRLEQFPRRGGRCHGRAHAGPGVGLAARAAGRRSPAAKAGLESVVGWNAPRFHGLAVGIRRGRPGNPPAPSGLSSPRKCSR